MSVTPATYSFKLASTNNSKGGVYKVGLWPRGVPPKGVVSFKGTSSLYGTDSEGNVYSMFRAGHRQTIQDAFECAHGVEISGDPADMQLSHCTVVLNRIRDASGRKSSGLDIYVVEPTEEGKTSLARILVNPRTGEPLKHARSVPTLADYDEQLGRFEIWAERYRNNRLALDQIVAAKKDLDVVGSAGFLPEVEVHL